MPFLVETPANYLRPVPGELDDGRFVAEVATRADCGILLDLHNVWTNERNGRQSVRDFVNCLPRERVLEVHLAGGSIEAGYYLDAHDGPVADDLLAIAADVLPTLPNVRAVIFEATPDAVARLGADGVRQVLGHLHRLVEPGRSATAPARHPRNRRPCPSQRVGVADRGLSARREHDLASFTTRKAPDWVDDDPGAVLLRDLTDHARLSMITVSRPDLVRRLVTARGRDGAVITAQAYLQQCPARLLTGDEGAQFAAWWQPEKRRALRVSCGASMPIEPPCPCPPPQTTDLWVGAAHRPTHVTMTFDQLVGKIARVTVTIHPPRAGEILVLVRGGSEQFAAASDEVIAVGNPGRDCQP